MIFLRASQNESMSIATETVARAAQTVDSSNTTQPNAKLLAQDVPGASDDRC